MPRAMENGSPDAPRRSGAAVVPLLVAAAVLMMLFPARVMECDAVIYASRARMEEVTALCDPGHLAYGFLERAALLVGQRMSPPLNSIFLLQYVSMAAALMGAYFFYRALTDASVTRARALAFTTMLLISYGYWHYATQGESYVLAAAFLVGFLWRFVRFMRAPSVREGVAAGLMLAAATLLHQTSVLMFPAALVGALLPSGRRQRVGPILAFAFAAACATALPYLAVGWTILRLRTPGEFQGWIMGLSKWGHWGGWSTTSPAKAAVGFTRSFVGSHFLLGVGAIESFAKSLFPLASWEDELAIAAYVPRSLAVLLIVAEVSVLGVAAVTLARAARRLGQMLRSDGGLTLFLAAWILTVGIFFMWWCPQRAEFWIPMFPPVLMLVARSSGLPFGKGLRAARLSVVFLAALFAVNFWGSIHPQSLEEMEPDTLAALAIEATIEPGDVVISDGSFSGRASQFVMAFDRIDLTGVRAHASASDEGADRSELVSRTIAAVDSALDEAESCGRSVYLLADPLVSEGDARTRYERQVAAIGEEFDISERIAIRADIDVRSVKRRG